MSAETHGQAQPTLEWPGWLTLLVSQDIERFFGEA